MSTTRIQTKNQVLLFPFNGNAREALDCLGSTIEPIGFIDDNAAHRRQRYGGLPVMGREAIVSHPHAFILAVPGGPDSYRDRAKAITSLHLPRERFISAIHPMASVSPQASIGIGALIMAGAVVTSNARIGDHVCILPNAVIHHDVVVGDLSLIGSGVHVCGAVHIGENCFIGSGSNLKNHIQVGARALIGLGSNVIHDVLADQCVAGNPARVIERRR